MYTLLDVMADIGGLIVVLRLIGQLVMAVLIKCVGSTNVERYLISRLFKVDQLEPSKKIKKQLEQ